MFPSRVRMAFSMFLPRFGLLFAAVFVLASCVAGATEGGQCRFNHHCAEGLVCSSGACRIVCSTSRDCPASRTCRPGDPPSITVCLPPEEPRHCLRSGDCDVGFVCGTGALCQRSCRSDYDCLVADPSLHCQYIPSMSLGICTGAMMDAGADVTRDTPSDISTDGLIDALPDNNPGLDVVSVDVADVLDADGAVDVLDVFDAPDVPRVNPCAGVVCAADQLCNYGTCVSSNVLLVSGASHTCVVRSNASVACWGLANMWQLAQGSTVLPQLGSMPSLQAAYASQAQIVPGLTAKSLGAGASHGCAVSPTNALSCWGSNLSGQLGDGLAHVDCDATAGGAQDCAQTPVSIPAATGVASVIGGDAFSCALHTNGSVRCWGANSAGQLGDGTTTARAVPGASVMLPLPAAAISARGNHACAVEQNGDVYCWGNGRAIPAIVAGLGPAVSVGSGTAFDCAVLATGSVWCWGANTRGQLGNGTTTLSSTPVQALGVTLAKQVVAGRDFACARTMAGAVLCWGNGVQGQLGGGTFADRSTPGTVTGVVGAASISAMNDAACARDSTGGVKCWGSNLEGQLGRGTAIAPPLNLLVPQLVPMTNAASAFQGFATGFAMDRTGAAYGWGDELRGSGAGVPSVSTPVRIPGLTNVTGIDSYQFHACASMTGGTASCWGANNSNGVLGSPGTPPAYTPTPVTVVTGIQQIQTGIFFTCALHGGGTISCWGDGAQGKLGNGAMVSSVTPVNVTGMTDAVQFDSGQHSCAVRTNGTVWCWGPNGSGQLGNGTLVTSAVPVQAMGLTSIAEVHVNGGLSCARRTDGAVFCWGDNYGGGLGVGSTATTVSTPTAVTGPLTGTLAVTVGGNFGCAILANRTAVCWGQGQGGELGNGASFNWMRPPTAVTGLTGLSQIAAGSSNACATTTTGAVYCWGRNQNSQGGTGTSESATAQPVLGVP